MVLKVEVYAAIRAVADVPGDQGSGQNFELNPDLLLRKLASGVGDYQCSKIFADTRTLIASANEDLDLSGSLAGPVGISGVFTAIKLLYVRASLANINNVIIKPGASNGFLGPFGAAAHSIALAPGDVFLATKLKTGWAVTAATGDLFNVANSGGTTGVDYDIIAAGI